MRAELVLIGGGKMGGALLSGLIASGWATPADVIVVEKAADRRRELVCTFPGLRVTGSARDIEGHAGASAPGAAPLAPGAASSVPGEASGREIGGLLLAVKPADARSACEAVAPLHPARVLSIMAGVTIARLEGWLPAGTVVLRAMPNTPALVGAGVSALAAGTQARKDDLAWASRILGAVGTVEVLDEEMLDSVTGLSGSGPAYVFLVTEALVDAGVGVGLPAATARALAVGTVAGAGKLLAETGEEPAKLRADVTSPGGTTARGIEVLEESGLRASFREAVAAAAERSRQLARGEP